MFVFCISSRCFTNVGHLWYKAEWFDSVTLFMMQLIQLFLSYDEQWSEGWVPLGVGQIVAKCQKCYCTFSSVDYHTPCMKWDQLRLCFWICEFHFWALDSQKRRLDTWSVYSEGVWWILVWSSILLAFENFLTNSFCCGSILLTSSFYKSLIIRWNPDYYKNNKRHHIAFT